MATVLVVRDTRDDRTWAMKLLLPILDGADAATRLRREFRSLSRLHHPNVLEVREWGMLGKRPWFTMELVDGSDLRRVVEGWTSLEPSDRFARTQSVLVQVARALDYVHERGFVHRDVSPGNVMIRRDGTAKLTDFGLVTDKTAAQLTRAGEVLGTVAYTAPEQLLGERVDARADLYGLGAILYLMLTGRKPFQAHTIQGYMERQLNQAPRRPSEVDPLVPPLLDRVCMRLLAKTPDERFASAAHLLHVLGDAEDAVDEGHWPPRAVGRTHFKGWVRRTAEDLASETSGGAALVTGGPGKGKTRLLDLAHHEARRWGVQVARGKCRPHDRPFGAFVGVYRDLKGDDVDDVLVHAFERWDEGGRVERYPILAAFKNLLLERSPIVVIIDELEKGDAATRELVEYLVRNTRELANASVGFVFGYEAADGVRPALLHDSEVVDRFHLGPLAPSEVEELVLSILPDSPASEALAQRLTDETGGSPAFIADMLRGLVDEGIIRRDGDRWNLSLPPDEISRSHLPLPHTLRASLSERLEPLSEEAIEVVRTVALSRRGLALDTLVRAVSMDEDVVMEALDDLVDANIVSERREAEQEYVELGHVRFADVLIESLDAEERRHRHRRLGELIERTHRHALHAVVEDLAYHFEQAHVAPKAYACLIKTAHKHLGRSLHEAGLHYLDRALAMAPVARPYLLLDEADRRLCETHLARTSSLLHLGRPDEALQAIERAARLANDVRDDQLQSRVCTLRGDMLRNLGRSSEAEGFLQRALEHAQRADVRALRPMPLYHLGAILWSRGQLDEARSCWEEARDLARELSNDRAEGRAYNGLGILEFCNGRPSEARRLLEKSSEIFERLGMLEPLAVTRVNLIELYLSTGMLRRAFNLADRTGSQAREVGHLHGVCMGLVWRARLLLVLGRPQEARRNAAEALRIATELMALDERILSLTTLVQVMLALGMGAHAEARVAQLLELLDTADYEGVAPLVRALLAQIHLSAGRPDAARAELDTLHVGQTFPHIQVRIDLDVATAWRLLGQEGPAAEHARSALETANRCRFRFYELIAHHELSQSVSDSDQRERHARKAKSLARSLSASLDRFDAGTFIARGWGVPR